MRPEKGLLARKRSRARDPIPPYIDAGIRFYGGFPWVAYSGIRRWGGTTEALGYKIQESKFVRIDPGGLPSHAKSPFAELERDPSAGIEGYRKLVQWRLWVIQDMRALARAAQERLSDPALSQRVQRVEAISAQGPRDSGAHRDFVQ